MTLIDILPHVTASLNGLAGMLSLIGVLLIKSKQRRAHQYVMTSAVIVSGLFLLTYLAHHVLVPLHPFPGQGNSRIVYFSLLFSHVGLAIIVTPMIIMTFMRARYGLLVEQFDRHKALARWTFPIWFYVSVTGIAVYWLLYHTYATASS